MDAASKLYHPDILAYAQNPARWRKEHDAQYIIKAYNPLCGDKFEIRLDIGEVIIDTSFFGYGCVVSKASTALLTEMLMGKYPEEARQLVVQYIKLMTEENDHLPSASPILPFLNARAYPGRLQCALLGWKALIQHSLFHDSDISNYDK